MTQDIDKYADEWVDSKNWEVVFAPHTREDVRKEICTLCAKVAEEARREERARIVKLLKRHKPSLIDCNIGWKHKLELDDLITQLSDK